jgi:ubiquinone/menaquinone biosynthesis C-methylase UbiE
LDPSRSSSLDRQVAAYYEVAPEESRLDEGAGRLELERTLELFRRFGPPPPAVVLDVGGGPGRYAERLAEEGYEVHLIDPVERLVAQARTRSLRLSRPIASCRTGDARAIDFPDACADAVLLLGPLYHLTDAEGRSLALGEARRVLAPGGRLFAAAISRFASALDGLARNLLPDPRFLSIVERDLASGQHRNETDRLDYFTTAYFHRPEELRAEVETSGLALDGVFTVEGPAWLLQDLPARWADPPARAALLAAVRLLESEPALMGASAHLLAVATKEISLPMVDS